MGSALLRAAHVRDDRPPWILQDTVAEQLLDPADVAELESSMAAWPPQVRAAFRVSHAVRTRLAEDVAISGLPAGRRDYVLLGAGLDSFAWRHRRAAQFIVWEIDHPDTQAWKRMALRRSGLGEPPNVRFMPADLSSMPVQDVDHPGLGTWNWMGVTMYLQRSTTEATLRSIASCQAGTTLVADFLVAPDALDTLGQAVRATSTATVAAANEPVAASYTTEEVEPMLRDAGFTHVDLFGRDTLRARYLSGRHDLLLPNSTVIAVATV